jgi:hypothetical protein
MQALVRLVGAHVLARDDTPPPGRTFSDEKSGASVRRVQVDGVQGGFSERAIAIIPQTLPKDGGPVEVLLYLHGHLVRGAHGYDTDKGKEGDDVAFHRIPQQLAASTRPMMAILPQGGRTSEFNPKTKAKGKGFAADAYIADVFARLAAMKAWGQPTPPTPGPVVLAGHSGADVAIDEMVSGDLGPKNLGGLFLFDTMWPGAGHEDRIWKAIERRLEVDLSALRNILSDEGDDRSRAEPKMVERVRREGFRLYDVFGAGGTYDEASTKLGAKKDAWLGREHVRRVIGGPKSPVYEAVAANLVVKAGGGAHDYKVGAEDHLKTAIGMLSRRPLAGRRTEAARRLRAAGLERQIGNRAFARLLRDATPASPAPKTDAEQWEADWNDPQYAKARGHFAGPDRPVGTPRERYDVLCPLYKAHGIARPLVYVAENITTATFYGHKTPAHKSLADALTAAETALRAKGYADAPFGKMWAFNPRTQSGGQWSNHADGKAVDLDEATNPRLLDRGHRAVISALTGFDISKANPGADRGMDAYDAAAEASRSFQEQYSSEGLAERIADFEEDEAELEELRKAAAEDLAAIPTGRKATKDDVKRRAAAQKVLRERQAALKAAVAQRKTLEREKARFDALDAAVDKLQGDIEALEAKIQTLQRDIDLLEAGAVPGVKNPKKAIAADNAAIKAAELAIKKAQKRLDKAVTAREGDTLRGYAEHGFLDLKKDLVEALKAAGLGWGGDYSGAKDFMHFEVR